VVRVRSLRRTLGAFQNGRCDPTTRLTAHSFLHATHTPDGPGTLLLTWVDDPAPADACGLEAEAWGAGGGWLLEQAPAMTGLDDVAFDAAATFPDASPVVVRALRATRTTWFGASHNLYHLLLGVVLAQRITGGEAIRQWYRLCHQLGEPAPGPQAIVGDLRLPPAPSALHRRPAWWFHPLGIETKRARALTEVARHSDKYWGWCAAGPAAVAHRLELIPGVGAWTVGSVLGPGLGDPDAVPVGDFHYPNIVAWNLAGEARADDARMLALLAPYQGQRGRVLHAVTYAGASPPAFGPKVRLLPVHRL
jgi:3-methyladenine DNA glycosylase/8-oxoguanine DNA glycosylase